jgi:hypothetical protein
MNAFKALDAARAAGIELRVDGIDLVLSAADDLPAGVIDMLRRHKRSIVALLQPGQPWKTPDWQAYFEERAAIAEFDGGLSRPEAEVRAFECCVNEWLCRMVTISALERCPICGDGDRPKDTLLPVGLAGACGVWLHGECSTPWWTARKAEAVVALAAMDIKGRTGRSP